MKPIKHSITKPIYNKCIPTTPSHTLTIMIDNDAIVSRGKTIYFTYMDLSISRFGIRTDVSFSMACTCFSLNFTNNRVFDQFQFIIE